MRRRNFGNISRGLAIFLLLALWLASPSLASSAEPAAVTVSAPGQAIEPGEQFTISIAVEPNNAIAGMQFNLSFNPSLVTASSVAEGNLLSQGGANTYFSSGEIDNQAGTITGVFGAIITPGGTVSTGGVFATITLLSGTTEGGTCPLTLSNVVVGDINGQPVPVNVTNGAVTVSGNQRPVLGSIGDKTADKGQSLQFTISASDPDGDSLAFSYSNLPQGASFDSQTRLFSWTPDTAGTYSNIHFEVSDGELTDSEDITITVNTASPGGGGGGGIAPVNDETPPTINDVVSSEVTRTSADIRWTTDELSTSQVEYWASPSKLSPLDERVTKQHKVHLSELTAGTIYHFKTMSMDGAGNLTVSEEQTFTTLGAPATPTVSEPDIITTEGGIDEEETINLPVTNVGEGAPGTEISTFSVTPTYDTETNKITFARVTYGLNNLDESITDIEFNLKVSLDGEPLEEVSLPPLYWLEPGGMSGSRDYIPSQGWRSGTYIFRAELYVGGQLYVTTTEEKLEVTASSAPPVVSWVILGGIIGAALVSISATTVFTLSRQRRMFQT